MIQFVVKQDAPDRLKAYLQGIRDRVTKAARVGLQEAMEKTALNAISEMEAAGIRNRTGLTAASILRSAHVSTILGGDGLKGSVTSWRNNNGSLEDGLMPMGKWLGDGTNQPAVSGRLMAFFSPDGQLIFTRKRRAYQVTGHGPFMNRGLQKSQTMIVETVRERMLAAVSG